MTRSTCLGMIHGRISKLLLDMEGEKELEEELRVRYCVGEGWD